MENSKDKLTSVEIGSLWTTYMSASLSWCVLQHFIEKMADMDMKELMEHALDINVYHLQTVEEIFTSEGFPVPEGFTKDDVNADAPRLYSDTFCLIYVKHMANYGLSNIGTYYRIKSEKAHCFSCGMNRFFCYFIFFGIQTLVPMV